MSATGQDVQTTKDFDQLKTRLKTTWMSGDYDVFSRYMEKDAEGFFHMDRNKPGMPVPDGRSRAGQLALDGARARAQGIGSRISTHLPGKARARAAGEGLQVFFREGDAEALPYRDGQFDAVV